MARPCAARARVAEHPGSAWPRSSSPSAGTGRHRPGMGKTRAGRRRFTRSRFPGCPDQHDQSRLHRRQQGVLLGLVETVHLVEEQDGALALLAESPAGRGQLGAHVLDGGRHSTPGHERLGSAGCDDLGDGGLAGSCRPPQHQRRHPVRLDQHAQWGARPQQVVLAHDRVQGAGTQAGGQRLALGQVAPGPVGKEAVGHHPGVC